MHSPDVTAQNIEKIAELFPGCVTEAADGKGGLRKTIDFDQLRQELSDHIVEGPQERYHLNWPGKREALLTANAPIAKTLRPCREESVDFDTTQNLFIEGDNLEALKLLQETYLGKVKMIYIDPPYNTGRDFLYNDDFSETSAKFLERSNQKDDESNKLLANTESNGRFHSDWLTMIYTRLSIAKRLLSDNGVIFISIDDNEYDNLSKICEEIFGGNNFIGTFTWETKRAARGVPPKSLLMHNHEYVLCYSKNSDYVQFIGLNRSKEDFHNPDNDSRGVWRSESIKATGKQDNWFYIIDKSTGNEFYGNWAFSEKSINKMLKNGLILFPQKPSGTPRQKKFFDSYINDKKSSITSLGWHSTEASTKALMDLFDGKKVFDFPKPISLISHFVDQSTSANDIIVDFFAGSGSTADAIIQLNSSQGTNRRIISVQLPEETGEASEAKSQGFTNIAEIAKERIRRAGKQILEGECHPDWNKDVGFRVLKIDSSNMADTYYRPDATNQSDLLARVDNIKEGRDNPEDLLFQVMLDWAVDLTLPIRREKLHGKTVFFVNHRPYDLMACFDDGISEELIKELASYKPLRMVFKDTGFASDSIKINAVQIFKQLSEITDVKAI